MAGTKAIGPYRRYAIFQDDRLLARARASATPLRSVPPHGPFRANVVHPRPAPRHTHAPGPHAAGNLCRTCPLLPRVAGHCMTGALLLVPESSSLRLQGFAGKLARPSTPSREAAGRQHPSACLLAAPPSLPPWLACLAVALHWDRLDQQKKVRGKKKKTTRHLYTDEVSFFWGIESS